MHGAVSRFVPIYHERRDYKSMLGTMVLASTCVVGFGGALVVLTFGLRGFLTDEVVSNPLSVGLLLILIAMAPMATDYAEEGGRVSERLVDYYAARARGGVGLVITEVVCIDETFPYMPRSLGLWSDDLIPSMRTLVDAVHAAGAAIAPQIPHSPVQPITSPVGSVRENAIAPTPAATKRPRSRSSTL